VKLKNTISGSNGELDVKCVFVAIGYEPNTAPFRDKLEMDENGYLIQRNGTRTNLPGVFAAGDVADHVYRQAVTAAGEGCAAAIDAERWLAEQE
jgi:thioredoxin reductase (NADPH)